MSVAVFAVYTCTTFESGDSYLDADARIVCYDNVHQRYMGGAAVWLVLIPVGVPAFFLWLLRRFKVPQLATLLSDNAWLREAVKLAWAEGMAQPADAATLTVDSISTLHLEALFAFFMHDVSAEDAAEILAGTRPPFALIAGAPDAEGPDLEQSKTLSARMSLGANKMAHRLSGFLGRLAGVKSLVSKRIVLINSVAARVADQDEAAARRTLLLTSLLTHLRNTDDIAVPPLVWEQPTEVEAAALALCSPDAASVHVSGLRCADVPRLMDAAMAEVSFLFGAYRVNCWYWCVPTARRASCRRGVLRLRMHCWCAGREVVELIRKLALTSILALIVPGSAGQIVCGLLISFATLVATLVVSPYAQRRLNLIGQVAQMHLFFLLFVALLLKVCLSSPLSPSHQKLTPSLPPAGCRWRERQRLLRRHCHRGVRRARDLTACYAPVSALCRRRPGGARARTRRRVVGLTSTRAETAFPACVAVTTLHEAAAEACAPRPALPAGAVARRGQAAEAAGAPGAVRGAGPQRRHLL